MAETRDCYVGVRMTPAEALKAMQLSQYTSEPGNLSAGLRWAIEHAAGPDDLQQAEVTEAAEAAEAAERASERVA